MVNDLARVGYEVESVWDLIQTPLGSRSKRKPGWPEAVPVLIEHLPRPYHPNIREGIVRALTVPFAHDAVKPLIDEFRRAEPGLRWVIGNALSIAATAEDIPAILPLLDDTSYGSSRNQLVHLIAKGPDAVDRLIAYLADPDLAVHAIIALGNLRDPRALPHIRPFLDHPDGWARDKVRRAVRKLETWEKRLGVKRDTTARS